MTTKPGHLKRRQYLRLAGAVLALCLAAHASPRYRILHNFTGAADGDGGNALAVDDKGNVYGASLGGGSQNCGAQGCGLTYELTMGSDGEFRFAVLYDFTGGDDAGGPRSPLLVDGSGNLYGTTTAGGARGGGTVFELTPGAGGWTLTTLYSFCNRQGCIGLPSAGVVMDPAGNLYTTSGETEAAFEISLVSGHWKETTLHKFRVREDGSDPYAGLILDASGNLYGTTGYGGTGCEGDGCGTVYELSPEAGGKWKETVLHRFDSNGGDGVTPGAGALFMDPSGNLYGTTEGGGANTGCAGVADGPRSTHPAGLADLAQPAPLVGEGNCGTVFKLTKNADGRWDETILHSFAVGAGGYLPDAGVVMDEAGNIYGTTDGGGSAGCGVIYKLAPAAKGKWKYSLLHTFGEGYDGCLPSGNLAIDSNGNLYGGTIFGGTHGNGVVFELTP